MELYGRRNGSESGQQHMEWAPAGQEQGLEESMRRLNLWEREVYPERPGAADCGYYMRTGSCGYGAKCRYNHPRDRGSSIGGVREYPERVGEPSCQYYLRTGTCKFGPSCKFNHPKDAGGSLTNVPLNIYGYPLRPGQQECSYYLQKGQCKFGRTCKFDHPQPAGLSVPAPARPFYPTVQSLSAPSEQYDSTSTTYRVARPPLLPGSYVPGAYAPMLLHPGVVPMPNWNPYSGPVSPAPSPGAQPSVAAGFCIWNVTASFFCTCLYRSLYAVTLFCLPFEWCNIGTPPHGATSASGGAGLLFLFAERTLQISGELANLIIQWELENTIQLRHMLKCQAEYVAGSKLDLGIIRTQPSGNNSSGSVLLMFSQIVAISRSNIQLF
ncbi:Zinc finger CCCH domain-containing protein 32 [Abeliophyllum distichum]|uniref:Zinc finger CCCH domain-containing protein 32 n=1 Tax=Abeliophyllum distichum TaxID=126358 RepID=A0ABD1RCI7_9LAMI